MFNYDGGGGAAIAAASNLRTGDNPLFGFDDFVALYPAYTKRPDETYLVNPIVINMYIGLAHTVVKEARWHGGWKLAMGLFVAHFVTLYLQGTVQANADAETVLAAAQTRGLVASESVADLSTSYDYSTAAQGLEGWASWNLTTYGQQYATLARMVGKGGMYVC